MIEAQDGKLSKQSKAAVERALDFVLEGLGHELMARLIEEATRRGLRRMVGRVLADNQGMLALARALAARPVVLGYYLNSDKDAKRIAVIPEPVLPKGTFRGRNIPFTTWQGYDWHPRYRHPELYPQGES